MNREEPSRYVPLPTCDWLVDLLPADGAPDEAARRHLQKGFRSWQTVPFLDAPRSPAWSRALYVPFVSDTRNAYVEYALMQRRELLSGLCVGGIPRRACARHALSAYVRSPTYTP